MANKLTRAQRVEAEELLTKAAQSQSMFWDDIRRLEKIVGFEIDSNQDLEETDLDTILANPGAPV